MNEVKKELAQYFLIDSKDYLNRYSLLEESATHIGLRTKLVVELMFSLECVLKSLLIYESKLDERKTYKLIKKLSHNISQLVENLTEVSKQKFNTTITIDFENYKVFHRYMFESEMAFREEFGNLGEKYYATINDFQWRKSFYNQIDLFIKHVETKYPFEFEIQTFSNIDINNILLKYQKLKNIIT